jgi:hypothetical protein
MTLKISILTTASALAASDALAQGAAVVHSGPSPGYSVVPPAERLNLGRVVGDAAVEVQLAMAALAIAALAAAAVWAMNLPKVGRADAPALAGALGRLRIVRSSGLMLGLLAASYILFHGFLGIANVRPAPTITITGGPIPQAPPSSSFVLAHWDARP